jgi:hypothetical protein
MDIEACPKPQQRAGVLGNVGLVKGEINGNSRLPLARGLRAAV